MPSLSPEAIEILKEMHGKTELRFDSEREAKAFIRRGYKAAETIEKGLDREKPTLYLPYCWHPVERGEAEEEHDYYYVPLTIYASAACAALHAAGVI